MRLCDRTICHILCFVASCVKLFSVGHVNVFLYLLKSDTKPTKPHSGKEGFRMAQIVERKTKSGDTRYFVRVRKKGHPVQTATLSRLTDAKKWARQTESAIEEGRHFKTREAKRHTLGEAIDRYLEEVMPHKPKSAGQQTPQLEWWKKQIGDHTLANVTPPIIVEQRAELLKGRSASTANRFMAVLGHCLTICVKEWGWLDDTPMRKISKLKEPRGIVRYLSEAERKALLAACKENSNPNLFPVVVIAISTGCRKQEILNLRWPDVDFERGQIVLHQTKNGERRTVPITGLAHDVLRQHSRMRRMDCDFVFPCDSKPVPGDIDRDFARARDAAKIKDFRFHDLLDCSLDCFGATLGV